MTATRRQSAFHDRARSRTARQVVAESVESAAIWQRLTEQGCDEAQGYLFSMPMPIEELACWQSRWERNAGHAGTGGDAPDPELRRRFPADVAGLLNRR